MDHKIKSFPLLTYFLLLSNVNCNKWEGIAGCLSVGDELVFNLMDKSLHGCLFEERVILILKNKTHVFLFNISYNIISLSNKCT